MLNNTTYSSIKEYINIKKHKNSSHLMTFRAKVCKNLTPLRNKDGLGHLKAFAY